MKIKIIFKGLSYLIVALAASCGEDNNGALSDNPKGRLVASKEFSLSNFPSGGPVSLTLTEELSSDISGKFLTVSGELKLPNIPGIERDVGCLNVTLEDSENNTVPGVLLLMGSQLQGITYPSQGIVVQADVDGWENLSEEIPLVLSEFPANQEKSYQKTICFKTDYPEIPFQEYEGTISIKYIINSSPGDVVNCTLHSENSFCENNFSAPDEPDEGEGGADANPDPDTPPSDAPPESPEGGNEVPEAPGVGTTGDEKGENTTPQVPEEGGDIPDDEMDNEPNINVSDWPEQCPGVDTDEDPATFHLTSGQNEIVIDGSTAVKITGNKASVLISDSVDMRTSTLCLVVSGNKANSQIFVSGEIDKVVVVARGNQTNSYIHVMDTGKVGEFALDFRGKSPSIEINGDGDYNCPPEPRFGSSACF